MTLHIGKILNLVFEARRIRKAALARMMDVNPVYTLPNGDAFAKGLKKIKTSVAISSYADETAALCSYVCPSFHALESWSDFEAKASEYALSQPTIRPLGEATASALESMLVWIG
jgi:molybdopterin-containing oxidoreductase family iron-sulfur binding subunit